MGALYGTTALAHIFRLMALRLAHGGTNGAPALYGINEGDSVLSPEAKRVAYREATLQIDGSTIGDVLEEAFLGAAYTVLELHYPGPASMRDIDHKAFSLWVQPGAINEVTGEQESEPMVELFLGVDRLHVQSAHDGRGEIEVGLADREALNFRMEGEPLTVAQAYRLLGLREADLVYLDEMGVPGIITEHDYTSHDTEIEGVEPRELVKALLDGYKAFRFRATQLNEAVDAIEGVTGSDAISMADLEESVRMQLSDPGVIVWPEGTIHFVPKAQPVPGVYEHMSAQAEENARIVELRARQTLYNTEEAAAHYGVPADFIRIWREAGAPIDAEGGCFVEVINDWLTRPGNTRYKDGCRYIRDVKSNDERTPVEWVRQPTKRRDLLEEAIANDERQARDATGFFAGMMKLFGRRP